MTQKMIKAPNRKSAIKKFLKSYPNKKIYDVTRTFADYSTPKNQRVYRVTGINKKEVNKYGKTR